MCLDVSFSVCVHPAFSGENPKRVYGKGKGVTPMSRMGSAWLMRAKFDQARSLLESQRAWCSSPSVQGSTNFPHDLALEGLVGLLRGEVKLNVHCYQVHDMEMVRSTQYPVLDTDIIAHVIVDCGAHVGRWTR